MRKPSGIRPGGRLRLVKTRRKAASLDKVLSKSIESLKKEKRAA